jgi:hypothetical protein
MQLNFKFQIFIIAEKPAEGSNAPSTPGRGWNDPPMLPPMNGMSPSTGAIKKTGINLNKRVAFPLSANAAGGSKPAVSAVAPPLVIFHPLSL